MRFDSYHPAINFLFFTVMILATVFFDQPVFLIISYLCPFVYSVVLKGKKAAIFDLILIPLILIYALYYASYHHFGVTYLRQNFIGNQITLEAFIYGCTISMRVAAVLMWFLCIHEIITSDKVVYLFGKITPRLSLFLAILLRGVPQLREQAKKINLAQEGIGRGTRQGNPVRRVINTLRLLSILVTWTIENMVQRSDSMKSRGSQLRGRTAFSIYRFDHRDRTLVISMFFGFTILLMGVLLDQTHILYNPKIIMNRVTSVSVLFYIIYAFLCLLPMGLQIVSICRFERQRRKITGNRFR